MADDTATIEQLRAELRQFRERDAATKATIDSLRERESALVDAVAHRDRALAEALKQQAATAELLHVIASSPTEVTTVLQEIVESAARVCPVDSAGLFRIDGGELVRVANLVRNPGPVEIGQRVQILRGTMSGRAVLDRRTNHIPDLDAVIDQEYPTAAPGYRRRAEQLGARAYRVGSSLAVPLLREGSAIGTLNVSRVEVRPFSQAEIALLETFADQAVIAIENARLFEELERRNTDLRETLEQRTATAEVLRVIASAPADLPRVLDSIIRSAAQLTDADYSTILQADGNVLRVMASLDPGTSQVGDMQPFDRGSVNGRVLLDGVTIHECSPAAEHLARYPNSRAIARGYQVQLVTPLMRQGAPIGTLLVARRARVPFTDRQIELLETFADQAVIAIENARLFEELEQRTSELAQALEQQTAMSEVLGSIATSPTDLTRVLDVIAGTAARLCDAPSATLQRLDDRSGVLFGEAGDGRSREVIERVRREAAPQLPYGTVPTHGFPSGRAFLERRTIRTDDMADEATLTHYPDARARQKSLGHRSAVEVPLLRRGESIGVLSLQRFEKRPFTDRQVELLETFADQAVIAIENARLFQELQERTAQLSRSVEELRALGEVGQVVSSSLDLPTVLTTIVG